MFLWTVIIIVILYFLKNINVKENFATLGPIRHAKLNRWDAIDYVDGKPPCHRGENSCFIVPCPSVFESDILCWKCDERLYYPQFG